MSLIGKVVSPSYIGRRRSNVDVLFLGEAPGFDEVREGVAFVGRSGELLRDCINACIPHLSVALDNVCPEFLGKKDGKFVKPGIKKIKQWKEHFDKNLQKHNPKVIVACGDSALKGLGRRKGGVVTAVGDVFKYEGVPVVVSVHPSYVLRNETEMPLLETVFNSLDSVLEPGKEEDVERLTSVREVKAWLNHCKTKLCGFDLEVSALEPHEGVMLTAAIATTERARWFGLFHPDESCGRTYLDLLMGWWNRLQHVVVQNLKFELKWMMSAGGQIPAGGYDTMLEAWMIDENKPRKLNWIVLNRLKAPAYWGEIDHGKLIEAQIDQVGRYNGLDALYCRRAHDVQWG